MGATRFTGSSYTLSSECSDDRSTTRTKQRSPQIGVLGLSLVRFQTSLHQWGRNIHDSQVKQHQKCHSVMGGDAESTPPPNFYEIFEFGKWPLVVCQSQLAHASIKFQDILLTKLYPNDFIFDGMNWKVRRGTNLEMCKRPKSEAYIHVGLSVGYNSYKIIPTVCFGFSLITFDGEWVRDPFHKQFWSKSYQESKKHSLP